MVLGLVVLGAQWMREGQVRIGEFVLWPRDRVVDFKAAAAPEKRAGKIERLFAEGRSDVLV